jgi:hypothetical protein
MSYLVKTRPPFSAIILALVLIITISEALFNWVWLVYSIPFYVIFYMHFCRYCCVVLITEYDFIVHYIAPWKKDIEVKTGNITRIDYEKGYYDFFARKTITTSGLYSFPIYCYDRLIIYQNKTENPIYLNVNTRAFDFDKILKLAIEMRLLDKL